LNLKIRTTAVYIIVPSAMYTVVYTRRLRRRHTLATSMSGCQLLRVPRLADDKNKDKIINCF